MNDQLSNLVQKAKESTLFTAPVLSSHLERFLKEKRDLIRNLARQAIEEKVEHIYWVGSGNSWVNLHSGKQILDRYTTIPNDCFISYDFIWRNPRRLGEKSWVFLASFSGATEDTVLALRYAKMRQARTIAIVNSAESLMGREADVVIEYQSKALYILPLAFAYVFSLEIARLQGVEEAEKVMQELYNIPPLLHKQYITEEQSAYQKAMMFKDENLFYVLGSGPLYGLAYKFGLTVFMENMRVNGSFMDASEFRHGPVEMLWREKPAMVFLIGTDESRPIVERVYQVAMTNGAKILRYDLADYGDIHPLLAPFVLMIPLQWFAVYSALLRGITDLDERVFMGRGILGQGNQIIWP